MKMKEKKRGEWGREQVRGKCFGVLIRGQDIHNKLHEEMVWWGNINKWRENFEIWEKQDH